MLDCVTFAPRERMSHPPQPSSPTFPWPDARRALRGDSSLQFSVRRGPAAPERQPSPVVSLVPRLTPRIDLRRDVAGEGES